MPRTQISSIRDRLATVPDPLSFATPTAALIWPLTSSLTGGATFPAGTPSFARSGVDWSYNEDTLQYEQAASNVGHYTSKGVFSRPQRVNSCTNFNAAPVVDGTIVASGGVLSVVSDAAALAASGLRNIVPSGQAYSFVNNTGSTQTVTVTCAANAGGTVSLRCFAKVPASNVITMQTSDAGHLGALNMYGTSGLYTDFRSENIASVAANSNWVLSVPAGQSVQFVLNQFEVGANTTSPIVVAGGAVTANQVGITLANNGNFPSTDYVVYCEVTPYGMAQESSSPVLWSAFVDANNSLQVGAGAPIAGTRKVGGVNAAANSRMQYQLETMQIALRISSSEGIDLFINGAKSQQRNANNTLLALTSGNLHIGRKGDSSQSFTGRIRNFRIYNSALSDANLIRMTTPSSWDIEFVPNMGTPCFDPRNSRRIWSMAYNATTGQWKDIYYSDDWGNTWTLWLTMASQSTQETICMDSQGSIYYADSLKLNRIDAATKAVTTACTFVANTNASGTANPPSPGAIGSVWTWLNWHFTEDNAGNIYIGQYQTASGQFGGQYMWKSPLGGNSFTRIDTLVDGVVAGGNPTLTERHVHNLKCNPYDDSIYVSWGDGANRQVARVTNKFAAGLFATDCSVITVPGSPGPTGITFTSEGAWFSTDNSGGTNLLQASVAGASGTTRYTFLNPMQQTPGFWIAAAGDNEFWVVQSEDALTTLPQPNQWSAIYKLSKNPGVDSPLQPARIVSIDSVRSNGSGYYQMSVNSRGMLPTGIPYVFVGRRVYSASHPSGPRGFYRLAR